ncbi:hypothetical protein [Halopiger xanaduensis]|uniref:Uncharacterized protein n=1 Tax=Halopiger xanaduensis (strain DSM 18323 / JCM 14033 / SH-6) TaxID=797210 RepID=F8DES3_HALXS|nr:hypothetical protein [Halopiger xanaduensis]AEH39513.1 hypothetical protein Halxa_0273 [Halopiger xanaduensis SH-6]
MTVSQTQTDATLPDGWERVDEPAPYYKYVARDAVDVCDHRGNLRYRRDVVVIVVPEEGSVGVAKGPAHRNHWPADDPDAAGRRLAREIDAWLAEGNGPYDKSGDLKQRLERAVTEGQR